jgi:metal-dependent amidase/aminoacylase/carboxypeptidase family protein
MIGAGHMRAGTSDSPAVAILAEIDAIPTMTKHASSLRRPS